MPIHRYRVLALALLAASLAAAPARARNDLGLAIDPIQANAGAVTVSYRVERPFTPRLEETLHQGMPATVAYEVGLWKRRSMWFDKLVVALRNEHKVAYIPWAKSFRVRSSTAGGRTRSAPSLDSLRASLFAVRRLPVALVAALDSSATYYVTVRVMIRPLTEDDLGEVEDWLAGEARDPEGISRGLPRYLFGITANLSGLGDRSEVRKSERFVPSRLLDTASPPKPRL